MTEKTEPYKRAVRGDQKEARRQTILDTAWHLFQTTSYEAVTMASVASTLGLAKGTLFLYFKTKEALFLAVVEQQLTLWFDEVDTQLATLSAPCTPEQMTHLLCQALESRPGLARLLAILHTILEQNIDHDAALHFKHLLLEHFTRTGSLLERCLPFLASGEGAHLLLQCHALVIGFWHLSDPAPIVRQVLQNPELQMFEVRFATEFSSILLVLLRGLECLAHEKNDTAEISQQEKNS